MLIFSGLGDTSVGNAVGNGQTTFFWLDRWCGDQPLKQTFPRIYQLATGKCNRVFHNFRIEAGTPQWHFNLIMGFKEDEEGEYNGLLTMLHSIHIKNTVADTLLWGKSHTGFSVKRHYQMLEDQPLL